MGPHLAAPHLEPHLRGFHNLSRMGGFTSDGKTMRHEAWQFEDHNPLDYHYEPVLTIIDHFINH